MLYSGAFTGIRGKMSVLIDSDAFCKLAMGGMLEDAVGILGALLSNCGRLPALPHMLRRGKVRKSYGAKFCDSLVQLAEGVPVHVQASDEWLDQVSQVHGIDPGEAQIFAAAAEHGLFVLTSDKRALRALKNVNSFPEFLAGRIVVLEAVLFALCNQLGTEEVQRRAKPVRDVDSMVRACFQKTDSDPRDCLASYFSSLARELEPFTLWNPWPGSSV